MTFDFRKAQHDRMSGRSGGSGKNESDYSREIKLGLAKEWGADSLLWKNHGDEFTERGISDITGVAFGKAIAIEVKVDSGWFSEFQIRFLRRFIQAGGIGIGVIYNTESKSYSVVEYKSMTTKGDRKREEWTRCDDIASLADFIRWL